jgi:hypothetical protein
MIAMSIGEISKAADSRPEKTNPNAMDITAPGGNCSMAPPFTTDQKTPTRMQEHAYPYQTLSVW